MKGHPGCLLALLGLVLTTSLSVAIIFAIRGADGPVYTVAALDALLTNHPTAWINQTVRVRARPAACLLRMDAPGSPCREWQPILVDATPGQRANALPLAWSNASRLVVFLRRLPLLGSIVPAPQQLRWSALAIYRVRVQAKMCGPAQQPPCFEALLEAGSLSGWDVGE
jgi:hypothetical protein